MRVDYLWAQMLCSWKVCAESFDHRAGLLA